MFYISVVYFCSENEKKKYVTGSQRCEFSEFCAKMDMLRIACNHLSVLGHEHGTSALSGCGVHSWAACHAQGHQASGMFLSHFIVLFCFFSLLHLYEHSLVLGVSVTVCLTVPSFLCSFSR